MTDYPVPFVDGQKLEPDDMNKILLARTADILPIDDTTRNFADVAGGLGDATRRFKEMWVDNIKIDGNTIISTDTDGDINLTPDGNGETNIKNPKLNGVLFSDYGSLITHTTFSTTSSFSSNARTSAQMTTDVLIVGYIETRTGNDNSEVRFEVYSDSNASPTTFITGYRSDVKAGTQPFLAGERIPFSFFVKRGNYYKTNVYVNSVGTTYLDCKYREMSLGV